MLGKIFHGVSQFFTKGEGVTFFGFFYIDGVGGKASSLVVERGILSGKRSSLIKMICNNSDGYFMSVRDECLTCADFLLDGCHRVIRSDSDDRLGLLPVVFCELSVDFDPILKFLGELVNPVDKFG